MSLCARRCRCALRPVCRRPAGRPSQTVCLRSTRRRRCGACCSRRPCGGCQVRGRARRPACCQPPGCVRRLSGGVWGLYLSANAALSASTHWEVSARPTRLGSFYLRCAGVGGQVADALEKAGLHKASDLARCAPGGCLAAHLRHARCSLGRASGPAPGALPPLWPLEPRPAPFDLSGAAAPHCGPRRPQVAPRGAVCGGRRRQPGACAVLAAGGMGPRRGRRGCDGRGAAQEHPGVIWVDQR